MDICCDRCAAKSRFTHLVGWPLDDAIYWLCQDCTNAIVLYWLMEHRAHIDRVRTENLSGRD